MSNQINLSVATYWNYSIANGMARREKKSRQTSIEVIIIKGSRLRLHNFHLIKMACVQPISISCSGTLTCCVRVCFGIGDVSPKIRLSIPHRHNVVTHLTAIPIHAVNFDFPSSTFQREGGGTLRWLVGFLSSHNSNMPIVSTTTDCVCACACVCVSESRRANN